MLSSSVIPGYPLRQGKVRDIYDLGDRLVLVATDRISAFDWVLPTPVPDKGRILTALTVFWLNFLGTPHHLLSTNLADMGQDFAAHPDDLAGRSCLVRKTKVVPIECVARGYLAGSAWKEYQQSGTVCGIRLPTGLRQAEALPEPIFTPATKAESGHDENITYAELVTCVGSELAGVLQQRTLEFYRRGATHAAQCGLILADTKFEFGHLPQGELILIDEVLTPDSSRYWSTEDYRVGTNPPSFDKQYVRDWLEASGWDKQSPPPPLPNEVTEETRRKYFEAYTRLTGRNAHEGVKP